MVRWDTLKPQMSRPEMSYPTSTFLAKTILINIILILGCGESASESNREDGIEQTDYDFIKVDSIGIEMGDSNYVIL